MRRISVNSRPWKYFALAQGLCFVILILFLEDQHKLGWAHFFIVLLIISVTALAYYVLDNSRTFFCDESFLYIKRKNKVAHIPLYRIQSIKTSLVTLGNTRFRKVKFIDDDGNERLIEIIPAPFSENFTWFERQVERASYSREQ
ncbi:hypothetical protein [Sanyastnella coralliicola]|uniref:hypothetical protein n=1 Tax=Sanyastnella coralliicola TaxID=3069118 RepID=UPI0027BA3102|nr:hypothetical protein [Longitalea sp. SCSIO 12813]